MAINFTKESFEKDVLNGKGIALVDFWADWCGPCKMLAPTIEDIAEEYGDEILVGKVNVDEYGELSKEFKVLGIPTVLVFKDGKLLSRSVGYVPKENLVKLIEEAKK